MTKPTITTFSEFAPLLIQKYKRYLPTAFDESLSLLQKVNMIIKRCDDLGLLTNSLIEQWNELVVWVTGEGLDDAVEQKINELIANGQFEELITSLFGDEFTYTSLKHTSYMGAMLDIPDIMQGVMFDKNNHCLYVAYEDQQIRFINPTLIIAKLDSTGEQMGEMFFDGFGHGDSFCLDPNNNENMVLSLVKDGEYKTVRLAFANGRTYTNFNEMTLIPIFNGVNWKISFSEDLNTFSVLNGDTGAAVQVYKTNLFLLNTLPTPDLTITLDGTMKPYQGLAVGKKSLFLSVGVDKTQTTASTYPQRILEYSLTDGSLTNTKYYSDFVSSLSANGYGEPEGLQIVTDDYHAEILVIGYVHGEFRQRINDIYEIGVKGTNPLTRRVIRGFYKENGVVKRKIDDETVKLEDLYEAGSYYIETALDTPTGRKGFLYVDVSWDGTNILQTFTSSAGIDYKRWIYWTNSLKTVDPWIDDKTGINFTRNTSVNATFETGVSNGGGFFPPLFTYSESFPVGSRGFIGGTFTIDSAVLPITGTFKKIATVTHMPYQKVPLVVTSFSGTNNNVMGYIDIDGAVYVQGSGTTSGYYTVGEQSYRIASS
jgi:hypothetical protein